MKFLFCVFLFLQFLPVFSQKENNYGKYIDSADVYVLVDGEKALQFLDSIPTPLENYIDGSVGKYYYLQGIAYYRLNEEALMYQSYLLAIRNAKKEKDYSVAGDASIELFSDIYVIENDSTAYKYLDDAQRYYTLANDHNGLLQIKQMHAYVAFTHSDYKKCNELILKDLAEYKAVTDDAYYYLFAIYMLTSNYIHLNDLENANKYLDEFRSLKSNPTIEEYNYKNYKAELNICMAKLHLDLKQSDSAIFYLSNARRLQDYLGLIAQGEFYSFNAEAYKAKGAYDKSLAYLDSLKLFQEKIFSDNMEASLELNDILLKTEETLSKESENTERHQNWLKILGVVLLFFLFVLIFGYKKLKISIKHLLLKEKNFSQLETKHEKLKVKNHELESYIEDVKNKLKAITSKEDKSTQRSEIRDLYRTINAETTTIKNDDEKHFEMLQELNESFFDEINEDYPQLGNTETLVCYYLKLGFKNKEIAFFLDRSIRSVESIRYRISKKMSLENSKILVSVLNENY
ncbi:helix-turn-helix transcriptional regulator [Aequorivita marisscotiae]|uniref:HTH luxR-type domain-containing protein n=1 Tax=Aequorivita marisscotiae TaxID=3040348 RepID=A0ABY8KY20_9FLAO|nr:hypothetical protein [Aequorivita sp. Ant34-E75]WGF92960.1 hypothetical protein QCQ61_01905 [Aequorivita sp. Ant34-E75]